jgi:hypothetical protein
VIVVLVLLFCGGTATAGYLLYAAGTDDEPTTSRTPNTQTTTQPTADPTTAPDETDEPTTGPTLPGFPGGGAKAIVYEVTGEGTANLFYSTPEGGKNESNVSLPWRREFTAPEGTGLVTVTATRTDASGKGLACRILVDGKEAASNEGGIISALCLATLF